MLTDDTAEKVQTLCARPDKQRVRWAEQATLSPNGGARVSLSDFSSGDRAQARERGIAFEQLALQSGKPDADPFDLPCHFAFNGPVVIPRQHDFSLSSWTEERLPRTFIAPCALEPDGGSWAGLPPSTLESLDNSSVAHRNHEPRSTTFCCICNDSLSGNSRRFMGRAGVRSRTRKQAAFFGYSAPAARAIQDDLPGKYASDGKLQWVTERKHRPGLLKVPPISRHGNVNEIIGQSGGADRLRNAVKQLQMQLDAA